jgi:hypothetical protein
MGSYCAIIRQGYTDQDQPLPAKSAGEEDSPGLNSNHMSLSGQAIFT